MAKLRPSKRQERQGGKRERRPRPRGFWRRRPRAIEAALAGIAHDIRTPLTGIVALAELLASSDLGTREREWANAKGRRHHLPARDADGNTTPREGTNRKEHQARHTPHPRREPGRPATAKAAAPRRRGGAPRAPAKTAAITIARICRPLVSG